ncbi:MAG: hypothetical protein ABI680_01250, partial [Chthoniobacteraceae bacterium]
YAFVGDQDIARLQVAVNEPQMVKLLNSLKDLRCEPHCVLLTDVARLQPGQKTSALDEFHLETHVVVAPNPEHIAVENADDVVAAIRLGRLNQEPWLTQSKFRLLGAEVKHLEKDLPLQVGMKGTERVCVRAFTVLIEDREFPQPIQGC